MDMCSVDDVDAAAPHGSHVTTARKVSAATIAVRIVAAAWSPKTMLFAISVAERADGLCV